MKTKKDFVNEISVRAASELLGEGIHPPEPKKEKREYKFKDPKNGLRAHQWKKGQSGNPLGRPVNALSLTALLNKKLTDHPELADAVVNALINLGRSKDIRAIEMTFDRIDGKVAETHIIEGEMPIRILFVPAQELIEQERQRQLVGETHLELPEGTEVNATN